MSRPPRPALDSAGPAPATNLPAVANPFVPGHGHIPPYFAGRAREQSALMDLLACLKAGRGAPRNAVLSGPCGNGKTALLRWLFQEARDDGGIDCVWLTPDEISSLDELANRLVPPWRFKSLSAGACAAHEAGGIGWELCGTSGALAPLLTARCLQRPLLAVLDEAHTLEPNTGQVLLNASQTVCAEAPFSLVLAGTPELQRHLNTMSATFWSRAEKLGIGRLAEDAATVALERPLAAQTPPITCEAASLKQAVAASQCYPYFVQLWGAALSDVALEAGTRSLGQSAVDAAANVVDRSQSAYYQDRLTELERAELLDVAARVAASFGDQATLPRATLNAAISEALPKGQATAADVLRCRDHLSDLGYIWNPPEADDAWQPGIPSLMDYVQRYAN